ncbi:MAG: hypothetical protein WCG83_02760 [Candidatus Peregrinibacteria bacterium]
MLQRKLNTVVAILVAVSVLSFTSFAEAQFGPAPFAPPAAAPAPVAPAPSMKECFGAYADEPFMATAQFPHWVDEEKTVARAAIAKPGITVDWADPNTIEALAWAFLPHESKLEGSLAQVTYDNSLDFQGMDPSQRIVIVVSMRRPLNLDPAFKGDVRVVECRRTTTTGKIRLWAKLLAVPTGINNQYTTCMSCKAETHEQRLTLVTDVTTHLERMKICLDETTSAVMSNDGAAVGSVDMHPYERFVVLWATKGMKNRLEELKKSLPATASASVRITVILPKGSTVPSGLPAGAEIKYAE